MTYFSWERDIIPTSTYKVLVWLSQGPWHYRGLMMD